MAIRDALIRLSKWKVDEVRRKLAVLASAKAEVEKEGVHLETSVVREQALAEQAPGGELLYHGFAQGVIMKREALSRQMDELEGLMEQVRAQVNTAYAELKKYEIAEEQHQLRERKERSRRGQISQDEITASRFERARQRSSS